jgi:FKBP-type peptidyl-prolyl cis-trans isomerase FkpA
MRSLLFICFAGSLLAPALSAQAPTTAPKPTANTAATTAAKPATTAPKPRPAAPALTTDSDKTIYALGLLMYQNLSQFDLSPAELELVRRALSDAAAGKPAIQVEEWRPKLQQLAKDRQERAAAKQKTLSQAYLVKAAAAPGAVKTGSGLIYRELRPGNGASPAATDTVKVNYRGTLTNGTEFDSSYKRNEPASFPLNRVIKCWTEGVQKMKVGGKSLLVCPSDLAYGDRAQPTIPAGSTLVFEVELLEINPAGAK